MPKGKKEEKTFWACVPEDGWLRVVHYHGKLGFICEPKVTGNGDTIWVCWNCKESLTPIEALAIKGKSE